MFDIWKGYRPLSTHERMFWLQRSILHQCPHVLFPFQSSLMEIMLHVMVKKTIDHHVLSNLASTIVMSIHFDLWISHGNVDTFTLIINFFSDI